MDLLFGSAQGLGRGSSAPTAPANKDVCVCILLVVFEGRRSRQGGLERRATQWQGGFCIHMAVSINCVPFIVSSE